MSENSPLREEILPGSVGGPELGVTDRKGPDQKCAAAPLVTCQQENPVNSESTSSIEELCLDKAPLCVKQPSSDVNSMEPSVIEANKRTEKSFSASKQANEAHGTTCSGLTEAPSVSASKTDQNIIQTEVTLRDAKGSGEGNSLASCPGFTEVPYTRASKTDQPIQTEVELRVAKGKGDSLASGHLGMEVAPPTLASLRAHLQAMVRDERDFVHTLNTKLTRLEGVVRHVRQEKDNLAAEFQDLEDHVDELNGGVKAFDAEMRDFSHADAIFDSITEGELRRTDSRFSFDMPELGVSFPDSGRRTRRGLWSRGKRWLRKKTGKVTPIEEEDLRELAADAAIKLEAFLQEKL